ncbi:DUF192 domain-containing protein [Halodesulfurarchaeum sp.]|uniref:DUF192 domain-containing protein n=1 Tax=Halodesulfurarchaeum sp. TaxID=1980530 RepID=UPI002FC35A7E
MGVQVVHVTEAKQDVLARDVERADSTRKQLQGVMFRSSLPSGYGLVFPFETAKNRGVHMLFVRVPIDVIWTVDEEVTAVGRLKPWTGYGRNQADRIIELSAGTATDVSVGDRVVVQE